MATISTPRFESLRETAQLGPAASGSEESRVAAFAALTKAQKGHLARLGVDAWHGGGVRGRGVKVAVLDTGFRGYRDFLGKSLPEKVIARSFRRDGNLEARDSQHGIQCGEVVHTLAPEAELLFANWESDEAESFLEAVRWARDQGARIVTCSVISPEWSDGEGGGAVHEKLAGIVGKGSAVGDVLCFACAGNTAQRHWSGRFQPNKEGVHEWTAGEIDNLLTPWGTDRVSVNVYCPPGATYELAVWEAKTNSLVGRSPTAGAAKDRQVAAVRFLPDGDRKYRVRVKLLKGEAGVFHLVGLSSYSLSVATSGGSIPFPADGPAVIAVGAVDSEGQRMSYSSCGPNSRQPKPDLVAPVPFPNPGRASGFGGTSAAAPQVAALAALCWSKHPDWTARQVREALQKAARDLGPVGHDYETGYGVIGLPRE